LLWDKDNQVERNGFNREELVAAELAANQVRAIHEDMHLFLEGACCSGMGRTSFESHL